MSFLYPLFLAGIAAVGLPIVLHMIRRQTRKRVTFSSLMFLRTTVPRFRNRSRLENLPLLILRCIILFLLAFAFSRPFFPRGTGANQVSAARRIVLLIDTSASMRRTGIWPRAISAAQSALRDVNPNDRVCLMRFDQNVETLIGFEQWSSMNSDRRKAIASEQLSSLSPGWASTNLGEALVTAAEAIGEDEVNDEQQKFRTHQVVLVSDLHKGSDLEALQAYEWPEVLELDVKLIAATGSTNASLQLIVSRDHPAGTAGNETPSVRITNSPDSAVERFSLSWADDEPAGTSQRATEVYVPAGHSVVARVPQRNDNEAPGKLVLTGDDHDFDNALYIAPRLTHRVNILFIASESAGDSEGMLYYVQRAFKATGTLDPVVIHRSSENVTDADIEAAHLIITTNTITPGHVDSVCRYLESGRTVLLVMKSPDAAKTIAALTGIETIESQEAEVDTYSMLNRIELKHPLLAPFSEPRFGDFTKIHFWKHRKINLDALPGAEVLAWFDSDDPALFELHVATGSLLVLTSGWHPSDSQLALSSKFVPLLYSILEYGGVFAGRQSQYFVGDNVPISTPGGSGKTNPLRGEAVSALRPAGIPSAALRTGPSTTLRTGLPAEMSEGNPRLRGGDVIPAKAGMPSPQEQGQDALATSPEPVEGTGLEIRKPDNSVITLDAGQGMFRQTDLPGFYSIQSSAGKQVFALNLPVKECQTDVMPIEELEGLGVLLARSWRGHLALVPIHRQACPERSRRDASGTQGRDGLATTGLSESYRSTQASRLKSLPLLESEQKIWRWIFVGLLAVSFIEIVLAGWLTRTEG